MPKIPSTLVPGALLVAGALFATPLLAAQSTPGPVMAIQAEDDRDVPEGSQIPAWRLEETEEKVRDYKAKMNERAAQGLQGLPSKEPADPNDKK